MKTKEIKLAITAIISVIILYFGIIFLKGLKLFSTDNIYYVEMKDVGGLAKSGEVTSKGMAVGQVKDIQYNAENQMLTVALELNDGITPTAGSYATITKELLGAPKLNIIMGDNPSALLSRGDTIKGASGTDLMSAAGDMIPQIQALIPKLDSILNAVNILVNNPAIGSSLENLEYASYNLRATTDNINRIMGGDVQKLLSKANNICSNLQTTTDRISSIDINGIADNAGKAVDNANRTMENIQVFTNQLNNPNSTIGKFMNDDKLYSHIDSTALNASRLLEDLRLNPKRYVHFSLFGKKDK